MPRNSKTCRQSKSTVGSHKTKAAQLVVDLIERKQGDLPMFLRMALSDALYEAALLKQIHIFAPAPTQDDVPAHDVSEIAHLFGKSVDLFRVLHPEIRPYNEPEVPQGEPCDVIDLDLWRQSHPRPIKRCVVEV